MLSRPLLDFDGLACPLSARNHDLSCPLNSDFQAETLVLFLVLSAEALTMMMQSYDF